MSSIDELKRLRGEAPRKPSLNDLERIYLKLQSFNHMAEPSIPFRFKSKLPGVTAIYFLYVDTTVYYIGQSKNIQDRWIKDDHDVLDKLALASETVLASDARIGWIDCPAHLLNFVEIYLIGLLRPVLNIAHNNDTY